MTADRLWNFSLYTPKVVSIALGINGFSRDDGKKEKAPFDSIMFVNAYADFVQTVKAKVEAKNLFAQLLALFFSPCKQKVARDIRL